MSEAAGAAGAFESPMRSRLILALLAYAVIGALATVTLTGKIRAAILLLLVALSVKTWIASISGRAR
jgi:hypothetical protein